MAETLSPCRFKSWIKTISPSDITCLPLPLRACRWGVAVAADLRGACPRKSELRRSDWGVFKRHFWGVYARHSHVFIDVACGRRVRAEILVGWERRRRWSTDEKLPIVPEALASGARWRWWRGNGMCRAVRFTGPRAPDRDRYRRWLAVCRRDDGLELNAEIVRLGWAPAYRPGYDPVPQPKYDSPKG